MAVDRGPAESEGQAAREPGAGSGALLVLITHPLAGVEEFARGLVERSLAACVNVMPVTSVYRWQGTIEEEEERLLIVKTRPERLVGIEKLLAERHPYGVPECVVLEPTHVEPRYLDWLLSETGAPGDGPPRSGKEKKS